MNQDDIAELKIDNEKFKKFLSSSSDKEIVNLLKKFGKLPSEFSGKDLLLELLGSQNKHIRLNSILNLAKLSDPSLLDSFKMHLKEEHFSEIRKETASAIGRLRSAEAIPIMISMLEDFDPNVILQAIRGLLVFKKDEKISNILLALSDHKNEIIRNVIETEFASSNSSSDKANHSESPKFLHNLVVNADVVSVLKVVPSESIHLTFTSPPYYNARDYSIYNSYTEYLEFLEKVFREIHRVTKEGRFFIINTSPIIISRVGRKYSSKRYPIPYDIHGILSKMGWEFIDDIVWMKPEASAKNRVSGFNQNRKPLAYKPNCITECVMVYRKKTTKLIDWNIKQYPGDIVNNSLVKGEIFSSNVWKIDPVFDKVHSAVFPLELCESVIKYYSFKGDLVFDPFGGSGTFAKAALLNDRNFFLTEKDPIYFQRMQETVVMNDMFNQNIEFCSFGEFKKIKRSKNDIN